MRKVQDTRSPVVLTQSLLDELDLLRDVYRGLADVKAGRVVSHEEARARLLARYK
jgi:predicted transcriptional regulator